MTTHNTVVVSDLLSTCIQNDYNALASYLRRTYRSNLDTEVRYESIFERLVKGGKVKASRQLLDTLKDCIQEDLAHSILHIAVQDDPYLFQYAINIIQPDVVSREASSIFGTLCGTRNASALDNNIKIMLDGWADHIEYAVIEAGMIKCCINSYKEAGKRTTATGLLVQMIAEKFVDKIQGQGIQIAISACCYPQNLALMDSLFDRNLEQIHQDPSLMNHALLRCCLHRDTDTFAHILERCGLCICVKAFEFWSDAGDLEALSMILDISTASEVLVVELHKTYQKAFAKRDVELAECLINYAEQQDIELDYDSHITVKELVLGADNPCNQEPSTHWVQYDNALRIPYHLKY